MTLRNKISLIVIAIWLVLAGATFLGSQFIILKSFLTLEETQASENMLRVKRTIDNMAAEVLNMSSSWAVWDDTYEFIQDKNSDYIKSNLTVESFSSTKMDMVLYFNAHGNLVYHLVLNNAHNKKTALPPLLLYELASIANFKKISDSASGIIALPSRLLMVGSHPIVTSVNTGPVRGVIIMAKYFTDKSLATVSASTKVNVSMYPLDTINDSSLKSIVSNIELSKKFYLIRNNQNIIQYGLYNDIYGKPIALLKIEMPRNVYMVGVNMTQIYGAIFIFYSVILAVFLWILLQKLIVNRIEKINLQMHSFEKPVSVVDVLSQRLPDELTSIATLYRQATHDPLTGLANRNLLYQAFNYYSKNNPGQRIALLFCDMDKFKSTNDVLGHEVGDKLLVYMSEQLLSSIRKNDLAVRLGGDEFVLMLVNVDLGTINHTADRIFQKLQKPVHCDGHQLIATSSMGISIYPKDGKNIVDLLKKADIALYHAKENGGNHYVFYSNKLETLVRAAKQDMLELQSAIDNNELLLYFQPIQHVATKQIISLEVLLRWQHPVKGIIPAIDFIDLAEKTGLIIPIGKWVLNAVCKQVKIWQSKKLPIPAVSVNISGLQISYLSIFQLVSSIIEENDFDPRYLELEFKESEFVKINPVFLSELRQLKEKGVQLTIDNFGISHSALSCLRQMPVSKLKIDKSFISHLESDPASQAMTLAIIYLAHKLNLQAIADGVETQAAYDFLSANQIDAIQGYFLSQPLNATNCENFLRNVSK